MRVTGRINVIWDWVPGQEIDVDEMNRTSLFLNNREVNLYGTFPHLEVGDAIEIRIPSGVLTFKVDLVSLEKAPLDGLDYRTRGEFTWEGKYAGLIGGMSGVAEWQVNIPPDTLVETSAWDNPIPWGLYTEVRRIIREAEHVLQHFLEPEDRREVMHYQIGKRLPLPPLHEDEEVEEIIPLNFEEME